MNRATILSIITISTLVCFMPMFTHLSYATPTAVLLISPQQSNVAFPQILTVNVTVANVTDLIAWQAKILFNPAMITAANVTEPTDEFFTAARGPNMTTGINMRIENDLGYLIAFNGLFDDVGVNGSGTLCQLIFNTISPGISGITFANIMQFSFSGTYLQDSNYVQIPFTPSNGYAVISASGFQTYSFQATKGGQPYPVSLFTNSTPSNFDYNETTERMSFSLSGTDGTRGLCAASIPRAILNGTLVVKINSKAAYFTSSESESTYYLDFSYNHSIVIVEIIETIYGDLNGDRKIDMMDVAIVARSFGTSPGHPYYDPRADLNKDLRVNMMDIAIVAQNFGKTWIP